MKTGEYTVNLDSEPHDVVPLDELKKRLNADRQESISRFGELRLLGMGGVSEVFSGKDKVLNRDVAIKVLRPASRSQLSLVEGFVREARATAQIDHPNIIPVHEMGVFDDAGIYFTMKKVTGETLRSLIERIRDKDADAIKSYSLRHLLEVFISAGQAVAYAHSRGIVHCDLKPGNIMLGEYGEVLLMDWGLVRYLADEDRSEKKIDLVGSLPETGLARDIHQGTGVSLGGTPAFMAPEMFTEKAHPSPQTDQYALGCILYCILTNAASPFPDGLSVEHLMGRAARGNFVRPRKRARSLNIPRELEAICLKAMSADPAKRYSDVVSMLKDVRNYLDNRPVSARPPNLAARFIKLCLRHPVIPVTVITAVFAAIFFHSWWNKKMEVYQMDTKFMITDTIRNGDYIYSRALSATASQEQDEYKKSAELLRLGGEFDYFYTSTVEQLASLAAMSSLEKDQKFLLRRLAKQQIHFARQTRQTVYLERFSNMLRRLKNPAFISAFAEDEELQKDLDMIARNEGELIIDIPADITFSIMNPDTGVEINDPVPGEQMFLPQGNYIITIHDGEYSASIPFYLYLGNKEHFSFSSVPVPVEGCVPVIHPLHPDKWFHISKAEVSGDEYAEFLNSIKDKNVRERYAHNVLLEPGAMPVRGVTREQAEGFCAYLSGKTGLKVRLPSLAEWRLAAWGAPEYFVQQAAGYLPERDMEDSINTAKLLTSVTTSGSDVSPYGAYNMTGNVRELVNSRLNRPGFTITCGGSWLVPLEYRLPERTGNASGGERDVGFRYVLEAEK